MQTVHIQDTAGKMALQYHQSAGHILLLVVLRKTKVFKIG